MNVFPPREFAAPWPALLAEMLDYVNLTRLVLGGDYQELGVTVEISRRLPAERLGSAEWQRFRAALENLPGCVASFELAGPAAPHRVLITIKKR